MSIRHLRIRIGFALSICLPAIGVGCFETKVVNESDGGDDGSGGSGNSSGVDTAACRACAEKSCANEVESCDDTPGCADFIGCLFACPQTDVTCRAACNTGTEGGDPPSASAASAAVVLSACAYVECTDTCVATPSGSGDGGSGGSDGPSSGGSSSAGRSSTGGRAGSGSGGSSFGGGPGSNGGTGGVPVVPGVNWITFDGSRALPEVSPNAEFGIDGVLYAYSDGCSQIFWDEATRCATGSVCLPNPPTYSNWGVAVGFDFRNTGETGTPPNTKLTWNPQTHGASGIAWQLHGSATGLQFWVLNMDPVWGGQCSAPTCDIAGPPDGTSNPGTSGQLLFSNMVKDNWGGSGIYYPFDPAAVHAIQFKLPAINVGGSSFAFCIDRLGIVR